MVLITEIKYNFYQFNHLNVMKHIARQNTEKPLRPSAWSTMCGKFNTAALISEHSSNGQLVEFTLDLTHLIKQLSKNSNYR